MMKKLILAGMTVLMIACKPNTEVFHFDEMTYSPDETVFRLFAPTNAECFVVTDKDSIRMTLGTDSI